MTLLTFHPLITPHPVLRATNKGLTLVTVNLDSTLLTVVNQVVVQDLILVFIYKMGTHKMATYKMVTYLVGQDLIRLRLTDNLVVIIITDFLM